MILGHIGGIPVEESVVQLAPAGAAMLTAVAFAVRTWVGGLRRRLRSLDSDRARLTPLMLATMASQALIVVLAPTMVAISADLGAPVGAVGQARSVTAGIAIATSLAIASRIDALPISRLVACGAALALVGCAAVAVAPTLPAFLLAHVLVGAALACLLSAGFAGVAAFAPERRAWAIGYVAGANALAWILVAPVVGVVADRLSWRLAQAVPAAIALAALAAASAATAAPSGAAGLRLRLLLAHRSARRWIGAELVAYAAWTALLTFVGAFLIERFGVREAVVGWLLAAGAAAHFAASTQGSRVSDLMPRPRLVAAVALLMALLFVVQLDVAGSAVFAVAAFCLLGASAGVRTPVSGRLGLEQLPDHPGAMMAARTAATQLGYLLGALVGGAVIAGAGYSGLGMVLAAGMVASAWLVLRIDQPSGSGSGVERDRPVAGDPSPALPA